MERSARKAGRRRRHAGPDPCRFGHPGERRRVARDCHEEKPWSCSL